MYRIHGGTTVCWGAAVGAVVGYGGGAGVPVVRVFGGGASCVVVGGSSLRSTVAVRRGWSWAWRFLGGCGHAGSGWPGGGRACVWARVFALCSRRGFFLCLSPAPLFLLVLFFGGGGCVLLGCGIFGAGPRCGCVLVPVLVRPVKRTVQLAVRVMGGLQRENAAGDVSGEGFAGVQVGGGAVGCVSGATSGGVGNSDAGVVDCEGDVLLALPVGRVLWAVPWVAESTVVPMVMVLPVVSIVRVLHQVMVTLVCAAGGVTVQVVVRLEAPS